NVNNDLLKISFAPVENDLVRRNIILPLHSLWFHLERPRDKNRDDETETEKHNQNFHYPRRCFESRQQNRRRLNQEPRNDCIGDGNFVNIASSELGKKIVHSCSKI